MGGRGLKQQRPGALDRPTCERPPFMGGRGLKHAQQEQNSGNAGRAPALHGRARIETESLFPSGLPTVERPPFMGGRGLKLTCTSAQQPIRGRAPALHGRARIETQRLRGYPLFFLRAPALHGRARIETSLRIWKRSKNRERPSFMDGRGLKLRKPASV